MASPSTAFAAGSIERGRQALRSVSQAFRCVAEPGATVREAALDTADARIQAAGLRLAALAERDGGVLLEWRSADGGLLHRARSLAPPASSRDLEPSPLRDALEQTIGDRPLVPLGRLELRRKPVRILDDEHKTVAWIALEHGTRTDIGPGGRRRRLPTTLRLTPVRGYEREALRLARFLVEDLHLVPVGPDAERLRRRLLAEEPASRALTRVLRELNETQRANAAGVQDDTDSEHLHDFRVAVRRTRAALAQVGDVLPEPAQRRFLAEFDWLGRATNELRDLDVHLQSIERHRAALPVDLQGVALALEQRLRERRRAEHERIVGVLRGERYAALLRDWAAFLAEPLATADGLSIREVAAARILRAHRKVLDRGRAISAESPPRKLHRLRISCKKLRYLLELFADAFEPAALDPLVKSLKVLQDNLGALNDLAVQREALETSSRELAAEGPAAAALDRARLALVARLEAEFAAERARLAACFAQFDREKMHDRLRRTLHAATAGAP